MATRFGLGHVCAMVTSTPPAARRVAIIGGGPAGISALSQLHPWRFDITLFERRSTFGGIWTYDADPGACVIRYDSAGRGYALYSGGRKDGADEGAFCPPGAMYDGLRTNLPADVMGYRSYPYEAGSHLFPDRKTVEEYIESFSKRVVKDAGEEKKVDVKLGTAVSSVRRIGHDSAAAREKVGWGSKWSITSIDVNSGEKNQETFDHVVIASGRCNTPTIPSIPGLHHFKGTILHSAWYRSPLPFAGKLVLVVGNSSSGSDIARELSGYILRTLPEGPTATQEYIDACNSGAKGVAKVLHSYEDISKPPPLDFDPRTDEAPIWAKRIDVVPRIERVEEDGAVVFQGGEKKFVDAILFGTGYAYDFPYLDQQLAPFDAKPLIPAPPPTQTIEAIPTPYTPPSRTAPFLTNLDDWSLFYAADASIAVLGAPIRIVPMPLTQVQSRIVAAAWSGALRPAPNSTGLPRLDPGIPTTDPAKWTSRASGSVQDDAGNKTSDLGYPSDSAYQDALLHLLPEEWRTRGVDEQRKVDDERVPVEARDEGWMRTADFRNERRADTKRLRRMLLGY